jgi:DNA-binding NarL/FixJ family response regulator
MTTDSAANADVVVLDEDPGWTASVRKALAHVGRPVLEASNPPEALRLVGRSGSSLLVVGPRSAEALEWVAAARRVLLELHVIVVVAEADAQSAASAFGAGATAVISERSAEGNLASALALASAGGRKPDRFGLSPRELEILEHVTRGSSNAQIARLMWVSEQTVKFHLSRIYKKLGVSSRTEAAWVARSEGLLHDTNAQTGSP